MTMLDHARPTVCPTWCRVDHKPAGAAGDWHSQHLNDVAATGLPGEPDDVLVWLEQYAMDPTAEPSIRVDIDRLGNVAFLTPMFSRYTPGRARSDGLPMSCSSVVTIVAKFGQCFSSSEKNVAPIAVATTVPGFVVVIQLVISSGSGPDSRFDAMSRA